MKLNTQCIMAPQTQAIQETYIQNQVNETHAKIMVMVEQLASKICTLKFGIQERERECICVYVCAHFGNFSGRMWT